MKNYSDAITALRELLGKRLATSAAELCLNGHNETYYPNTPPDAVAYPETTFEVSQIVTISNKHHCLVTAYGAAMHYMKTINMALDPNNILNPNNIFPATSSRIS